MRRTHLTTIQKEAAIAAAREFGSFGASARAAGVKILSILHAMRINASFKERMYEARAEGCANVGDAAMGVIMSSAFTKDSGIDKTRLTAALSLANAYMPGFKGTSRIEGTVDHNVRVITAIPRPEYSNVVQVIDSPEVKQLPAPPDKQKEYMRNYMREYMRKKRAKVVVQVTAEQVVGSDNSGIR